MGLLTRMIGAGGREPAGVAEAFQLKRPFVKRSPTNRIPPFPRNPRSTPDLTISGSYQNRRSTVDLTLSGSHHQARSGTPPGQHSDNTLTELGTPGWRILVGFPGGLGCQSSNTAVATRTTRTRIGQAVSNPNGGKRMGPLGWNLGVADPPRPFR